jgi:putative endonuclease
VTLARQRIGRTAERLAAEDLAARGYSIVGRNVRVPGVRGEIDIIARHGRTLVFVEIKARSAGARQGPEDPVLMVDRRKQAKLRSLAAAWLAAQESDGRPRATGSIRFDVIGVTLDAGGRAVEWRHLAAAF